MAKSSSSSTCGSECSVVPNEYNTINEAVGQTPAPIAEAHRLAILGQAHALAKRAHTCLPRSGACAPCGSATRGCGSLLACALQHADGASSSGFGRRSPATMGVSRISRMALPKRPLLPCLAAV
jgi:hypothetical protein